MISRSDVSWEASNAIAVFEAEIQKAGLSADQATVVAKAVERLLSDVLPRVLERYEQDLTRRIDRGSR